MPEYKFTVTKSVDLIIPADSEDAAWLQMASMNPELLGAEWTINLTTPSQISQRIADGPEVLEDHTSHLDQFDDLSYLNPSLPKLL